MIDTNYYCDKCGKHIGEQIVNKEDRLKCDIYAGYIGDPVSEITYDLLVEQFGSHRYYNKKLEGKMIFCKRCSLEIAVFLGLLKENEYDKEAVDG